MMSPDPRTTTTTTSTTTTTTTTTSTTSTAATSMINAASVALPSTPPSASVACAAGKVAEPSSSAPAKKKMSADQLWLRADNVEKMVDAAVSFQQPFWDPPVIAQLYQALARVKEASESDTNFQLVWNTFYKTWESVVVPLKEFVDDKRREFEKENEQKKLTQRNEQRRTQGNKNKETLIAAEQEQKKLREKQHQQEVAALAQAHRHHFRNPDVLKSINEKLKPIANEKPNEKPTLCTAVVEGTDMMAFGISSVGNHQPFQAFFRREDGRIHFTAAAEAHATKLEPLRAVLEGIQKAEAWEVYVCAEVDAAVQLLLRGVRLEQIKTYATDFDFKYKERCAHCTQWVAEF
ncbi:hypothetical protein [Polyangium sorediatum]|uniref:Uncharacterized protein n=1 Tax=Polyangium sorediatum TaxID=889274 RepID=A0ABT6NQP6_9BACT|nr:hypothetical protein [Polyangium sorediatum]MDI1430656.1 hypothetical protein [Polyangium sorediatum]